MVLSREPLCRDCRSAGRLTPARDVHHIVKLRERPDLRLDSDNVMPLCRPCHELRTARGE